MPPLIVNTNQKPSSILWPSGLVNHKETKPDIGNQSTLHLTNSRISTLPPLEFYDRPERKKDEYPLIQGPPNIPNKPIKNLCGQSRTQWRTRIFQKFPETRKYFQKADSIYAQDKRTVQNIIRHVTHSIQIQLNNCIQNTWIHNEINDCNSFFKLSRKMPYIFST